jgi:MOSC domain-containing protein YiiM
MARTIRLVSVNVGQPEILTVWPGGPVYSAIRKRPVESESLAVTRDNLEGDAQADRRPGVHGGPEKAILAYASEQHLPRWRDELGEDLGPGAFGENLTSHVEPDIELAKTRRWE